MVFLAPAIEHLSEKLSGGELLSVTRAAGPFLSASDLYCLAPHRLGLASFFICIGRRGATVHLSCAFDDHATHRLDDEG
jgi:hypothetical protein